MAQLDRQMKRRSPVGDGPQVGWRRLIWDKEFVCCWRLLGEVRGADRESHFNTVRDFKV
jgi:hypothetical protein